MSPELLSVILIEAVPSYSISASDVWGMVINSGFVIKLVMILLLGFSVISWAIIIFKFNQFKRARGQSYGFLELFWKSRSLSTIYGSSPAFTASPVAQIFRVGYQELGRVRKSQTESSPIQLQGLDNVKRALRRTAGAESTRLSKALTFLATTGNTTPFLGLFGTVWGIMNSFHSIGVTGSANLVVVAPGISEALVTTAAGLIAAIPAVVAYNHFASRLRVLEAEMTNFVSDFLNILERDMLKRAGTP